jgi:hypothetical protein
VNAFLYFGNCIGAAIAFLLIPGKMRISFQRGRNAEGLPDRKTCNAIKRDRAGRSVPLPFEGKARVL